MRGKWCKTFLPAIATLAFFSATAWAVDHHHDLNGTWILIATPHQPNGASAIGAGTVVIEDRQGNVYISQNFTYSSPVQGVSTALTLDGRRGATARDGNLTGKAKWENGALQVKTTENGLTSVERFSLQPEGTMMLTLDRPGSPTATLFFRRE
jgi:hypothetical protein